MARVLFVCLHNAGRSQISKALFDRAANGRHESESAGTEPGRTGPPGGREVMNELGIDLSARSRRSSRTSWRNGRMSSSRWAAATHVPTYRASAISTGTCPTRRVVP